MRIYVKINADLFFECGFEFCLQGLNKLTHPPFALVVFLTVADKDVVIVSLDNT